MKLTQLLNRSLLFLFLILGVAACQNAEEDNAVVDNTEETGELVISLTDAEGDFLAYAVDVVSINMIRADGAEVETLSQTTRVDFSQYVELSELLTVATVPVGSYVSGSMTLDFSEADIQVEVSGEAVAADVEDSDGNAITRITLDVSLNEYGALVIAPGVPAYLTLDFDLASSNSVDTSITPPRVTVEPVLVADVDLKAPKDHRLRGLLAGVDREASSIRLAMRPFFSREGDFGRFNAYVDDETVYEVDGVSYRGESGLLQMAELDLNSWVVIFGNINVELRRFEASEVYAGESVPGSDMDSVLGVVLSRSGDELQFHARMIVKADGGVIFNKRLGITFSEFTKVTRQLSLGAFSKDDISVGQRLVLLGTLTEDGDNLNMHMPEHVRMLVNSLGGSAVVVNDGELTLALQHLNGRSLRVYNFAGTGVSSDQDADVDNYQVNTSSLSLLGVDIGEPVKVYGFVTPFASAPADFDAQTLIELANVNANMQITFSRESSAPFSRSSADGMVINLQDSVIHHVSRNGVITDLSTLESATTLVPKADGRGVFAVVVNRTIYVHNTFARFEADVSERLAGGAYLKRLAGQGSFDDTDATLTARGVAAVFRSR